MMTTKINDFCKQHAIRIVDDHKRAHRMTKMNTKYFRYAHDYNMADLEPIVLETEKLYTVEISESELESIAEFEAEVFNHMGQKGHFNLFETIMEQKQQEKYLRNKYPAVQKAYEQYSLMLKLAKSGEI
jgi:uncharacterized protein YpuA (DUF1002 family)